MKSPIAKRSIVVAGRKTSVSLEEALWNGMKEISSLRNMTLSELVGEIDTNRLLVGQSYVENTEIARLTLTSIGWASVAILLLVVAAGLLIAVRAPRRIDGIAGTMAAVGQGELAARISVTRRGDDIDTLARQVNAALDRLEALVAGMREVSINIAHDLKTPLNRLAITLESVARAEADGEAVGPALSQAEAELQQKILVQNPARLFEFDS